MHLHAALFQGEVGWEVCQWIPYLRHLHDHHKPKKFTVECRKGFSGLYEFADDVVEREIDPKLRPDMIYAYRGKITRPVRSPWTSSADRVIAAELFVCVPDHNGVPQIQAPRLHRLFPYCSDLELGEEQSKLVVHARAISQHPERNWSQWNEFVKRLPESKRSIDTVVWVGGENDYFPSPYFRGKSTQQHLDLRGAPIIDQMKHMRTAAMCVGASSGTMHVAQHTGAPVLVWSGNESKDAKRWTESWNPYRGKVRFIGGTWQPGVEHVLKEISGWRP